MTSYHGPILDFHNHLGRDTDGKSQTPDQLRSEMRAAGVARAVVFPFHTGGPFSEANRQVAAWGRAYPEFVPFGRLDPTSVTWRDDLEEIRTLGLQGIKIHPRSEGFDLSGVPGFWAAARDVGLPILFHSSHRDGRYLKQIEKFIAGLTDLPLVFGHAGLGATTLACRIARSNPNVMLEISINPGSRIEYLLASAGSERLLFGSDVPYESMTVMRKRLESVPNATLEDLGRIYWSNGQDILGRTKR